MPSKEDIKTWASDFKHRCLDRVQDCLEKKAHEAADELNEFRKKSPEDKLYTVGGWGFDAAASAAASAVVPGAGAVFGGVVRTGEKAVGKAIGKKVIREAEESVIEHADEAAARRLLHESKERAKKAAERAEREAVERAAKEAEEVAKRAADANTKRPPKPTPKFEPPTNSPQLPPAEVPPGWRVRTPPQPAWHPHSSRTAAAQQPRHIRTASAPYPRRIRVVSAPYPEACRNSAKRNSSIGVQQNQGVGIALSIESGPAAARLLRGYGPAAVWLCSACCAATVRLCSGYGLDRCRLASACSASGRWIASRLRTRTGRSLSVE